MMRIFILHHHLDPGGVTQIILSQLRALKHAYGTLDHVHLLLGEKPDFPLPLSGDNLHINSGLAYWKPEGTAEGAIKNLKQIKRWLKGLLSPDDILHAHNLNLGKNPLLLIAVREMIAEGYRVLNHCHDFAEDGRPGNYQALLQYVRKYSQWNLPETLYPRDPNILYAVLNSRDHRILTEFGLPQSQVELLSNPVAPPEKFKAERRWVILPQLGLASRETYMLYPVRGIRRKNLGEFLLWAALFPDRHWVLSRAPKNPEEIPAYSYWVETSRSLGIPVHWDAGNQVAFPHLVKASRAIITTSVVEGFGMAFVEPWLYGKEIYGRNLPDITPDFHRQGLKYNLYDSLRVPKSWLESVPRMLDAYVRHIKSVYQQYHLSAPKGLKEKIYREKFSGATVDFAQLSVAEQRGIVEKVAGNPKAGQALIKRNALDDRLKDYSPDVIRKNKELVLNRFNEKVYGHRLKSLYDRLEKGVKPATRGKKLSGNTSPLRHSFLHPKHFHLIRL